MAGRNSFFKLEKICKRPVFLLFNFALVALLSALLVACNEEGISKAPETGNLISVTNSPTEETPEIRSLGETPSTVVISGIETPTITTINYPGKLSLIHI